MKSVYRFSLVLSVCLLLLVPVALLGQTTGTVEGSITDQSGAALPGVTVEITSPNLQGTRTAVTSANGNYRFPSLPPGTYTVTATLAGFGKVQKRAVVTLDATASVDLQMNLSTTAEVTVTGEAPLVDSTSTTTGSNYNAKVIDKLPVGRNYADIVFAQPGVQADYGETQGRSLAISIYGSTSSENQFLIDGVNTTNVIKGFQGKDINNEFVQEVEVKTGGYQAEYGRNTGGVINVITKSGGNEFHGGAFGYYNDTGMRADIVDQYNTPEYSQTGDAQDSPLSGSNYTFSKDVRQEWGMDLGGYIWKDKIWFFGAYDRVQVNRNVETLNPTNSATFMQEYPYGITQNKYSGKLTLNLTQGTSIVGSVFSDAQTQQGALVIPTSNVSTSYNGRRDVGGPDYGARLNQLFGSFGIFTFQYAQHADRYHTIPSPVTLPQLLDYTNSPTGASSIAYGGFGSVFGPTRNNESTRNAYVGSFTAYVGNNEIKIGGDYQNDATSGSTYYTGAQRLRVRPCLNSTQSPGDTSYCDLALAPFYTNPFGNTYQVFYQHDQFANGTPQDYTPIAASPFNTPTKRYSAYIQDQWRVIPTLTVNLGVRYDSESMYGLDPITGPFKAFSLTDQWSPRIGVVWDFIGDGTSKLYASAGRFYYSLPTDLNVRVFTANSQVNTFNYSPTDTNQDPNAPRNQLFQGGNASGEPVDAGTKAAYQDELTLGVEKAIDPTLSVGLKGTYRTLGRTIEDRCDLDSNDPLSQGSTCALFNPGGTGPAASGQILTCDGSANPTDPNAGECGFPGVAVQKAKRIFRGIELTARKSFTNAFWAQLSFLYSSLRGNYSGAIREASGQTDPGINADYDYYQFLTNAYGNLELDRPAQGRIDMVYTAPFGLSAGLGFYVRSGIPLSKQGFFNNFYPDLLFIDQRGTNGRNPTDYDMNLSMSYNLNVGPVTITPMVYLYNVLNRQTIANVDQTFNPAGSFVTNTASPYYGQAGVEPGTGACPASASAPCPDNPDYLKALSPSFSGRTNPRLLRVALKVTF
jgi:hypothetical protein